MELHKYEVVITGAGMAGLMAAWEIAQTGRKVAVVEARDRAGGRVHTIQNSSFPLPVELGAEFIHGKLKWTQLLLEKAGIPIYKVQGSIWQKKNSVLEEQKDFIEDYQALQRQFRELQHDISVEDFIKEHLAGDDLEDARTTLKNYVEGYYAADTTRASSFALRDELQQSDDQQFRTEQGYGSLVQYLQEQCEKSGVHFFFSTPVQKITWKRNSASVIAAAQNFSAEKIMVTAPLGVLQSGGLLIEPLPEHYYKAIMHLGFGSVIKTILLFDHPFWKETKGKNLSDLSFLFSEETIPTWWTCYPKDLPVLTGWSAGPHARALAGYSQEQVISKAIESLADIFDMEGHELQSLLRASLVANWHEDPYCLGGYSYDVVDGGAQKKILQQPLDATLYFAGEAYHEGPEIGTVEAALINGRDTAHRLIASFKS